MSDRYPPSLPGKAATTYGPLPDKGLTKVALVYHTTETRGVPGYSEGKVAPHYTYNPRDGHRWWFHAELDRRVGTMRGSSSTGIYANEKAVQVELICYSDRNVASSVDGLWVGDFGDAEYQQLGAFYEWLMLEGTHAIAAVVTPTPAGGWKYGAGSGLRLSESEWLAFQGLTCHGAVPGQSHWDCGVMSLERVLEEATPMNEYRSVINCPTENDGQGGRQVIGWAIEVIDWLIATGRIIEDNPEHQNDWTNNLTDGRYWTMEWRARSEAQGGAAATIDPGDTT